MVRGIEGDAIPTSTGVQCQSAQNEELHRSRREEYIGTNAPRTLRLRQPDAFERAHTRCVGPVATRDTIVASEAERVRLDGVGDDMPIASNHRISGDHTKSLRSAFRVQQDLKKEERTLRKETKGTSAAG